MSSLDKEWSVIFYQVGVLLWIWFFLLSFICFLLLFIDVPLFLYSCDVQLFSRWSGINRSLHWKSRKKSIMGEKDLMKKILVCDWIWKELIFAKRIEKNYFHFLRFNSSSFPQTPLHLAAIRGTTEYIHALLQHGADVEAVDVSGVWVCESEKIKYRSLLCDFLMNVCWVLDMGTYEGWRKPYFPHFSPFLSLSLPFPFDAETFPWFLFALFTFSIHILILILHICISF